MIYENSIIIQKPVRSDSKKNSITNLQLVKVLFFLVASHKVHFTVP